MLPVLMAVVIHFFAPGMADDAIRVAMVESVDPQCIGYMKFMFKVELFMEV